MLKHRNTLSALAALFFVVAMSAVADDTAPKAGKDATAANKDMKMTAEEFVGWAWKDGFGEVKLAKLAIDKSKNENVRKHAGHIMEDHQKANEELKTIARNRKFTVTDEMMPEQQKAFEKLEKLDGAAFDREFVNTMVQGHEMAIRKFEAMSRENAGDVSAFAAKHLPALKSHLAMMRGIHGDAKGAMLEEPALNESHDVIYGEGELSESQDVSISREEHMESGDSALLDKDCELEFFVPEQEADEVSVNNEAMAPSGRLEMECELEFFVPEADDVSYESEVIEDEAAQASEPDIEAERMGHVEPVEFTGCATCKTECDYCE